MSRAFASAPSAVIALEQAGVDGVDLGNNHMYDLLESGLEDTLTILDQDGLAHFGAGGTAAEAWKPAILTARGQAFAFIGCTTIWRPEPPASSHDVTYTASDAANKGGAARCEEERLRAAVQEAKKSGLTMSPAVMDDALRKMRANAGSEDAFQAGLRSSGLSVDELRAIIEREYLFEQIAAREVDESGMQSECVTFYDVLHLFEAAGPRFTKPAVTGSPACLRSRHRDAPPHPRRERLAPPERERGVGEGRERARQGADRPDLPRRPVRHREGDAGDAPHQHRGDHVRELRREALHEDAREQGDGADRRRVRVDVAGLRDERVDRLRERRAARDRDAEEVLELARGDEDRRAGGEPDHHGNGCGTAFFLPDAEGDQNQQIRKTRCTQYPVFP